jgi:hypothetical protein
VRDFLAVRLGRADQSRACKSFADAVVSNGLKVTMQRSRDYPRAVAVQADQHRNNGPLEQLPVGTTTGIFAIAPHSNPRISQIVLSPVVFWTDSSR